ncbi:MAG: nitrous oxide reductase family maturation protein NosD, partial [Polyangiales bacterium]
AEPMTLARTSKSAAAVLLLAAALLGCRTPSPEAGISSQRPVVARPERPGICRDVPAGASLQASIDAAPQSSSLCLAPGVYLGPLRIARSLSLFGGRDSVVRSNGSGTTISVDAPGTRLLGFTVDGSGHRFDTDDAAVHVQADDVVVDGLRIVRATFGVLVERAKRVHLHGNEIEGDTRSPAGLRGDAIRLWETRDSLVDDNHVRGSRDVAVWYAPHNVFRRNLFEHGRYGTHFMYSHDNLVQDCELRSNVVGVFVMYSRNVRIEGSRFIDASGAAGMGVGLKESGNITLRDNWFVHDTAALYVDTSPLNLGDHDDVVGNRFLLSETAVVFHGRAKGNAFRDNSFAQNRAQVVVEGGGDALESPWSGNAFDDYQGYDLDGDGRGDVPYAVRSLSLDLQARYPELAFFADSSALAIVEAVGRLVPLATPHTLVLDPRPRLFEPSVPTRRRDEG